ncbi:MAG: hypothetical protein ABIN80_19020 [Dyadobacter sp.]|uniref:hypothetical protein n=1 Tax=Dyadobacter sp. TaxID=1914288 RepID=UPI003266B25A
MRKYINVDYFLVFFLIALSTIPFFKKSVLGMVIILILLGLKYKKLAIKPRTLMVISIVSVLEIFHFVYYPNYEFFVLRDQILYFVIAGLIIYHLKLRFLPIYNNIIYLFTIISFPIFLTYYVSKDLVVAFSRLFSPFFLTIEQSAFNQYERISPIFFTFDGNFLNLGRNNGPFWEPTVFATMLIIAQIFNFLLTKTLFNKRGIIFTIAILTTFSTTGYLAYILLLTCYVVISKKIKFEFKLVLAISLVLASLLFFTRLGFLESKIKSEIQNVQVDMTEKGGDSRLASAILDIQEIKNDIIAILFGKGSSKGSRTVYKNSSILVLRNCGDTALIVQWGLPFFIFYFALIFISFRKLGDFFKVHSLMFSISCTLIIFICGFSETFFDLPFFHAFIFFGLLNQRLLLQAYKSRSNAQNLHLNTNL